MCLPPGPAKSNGMDGAAKRETQNAGSDKKAFPRAEGAGGADDSLLISLSHQDKLDMYPETGYGPGTPMCWS